MAAGIGFGRCRLPDVGCGGIFPLRTGLVLEPLQLAMVEHGRKGEHLQGHLPSQRNLLGLTHHPHPAATDLGKDAVVAQHAADRLV